MDTYWIERGSVLRSRCERRCCAATGERFEDISDQAGDWFGRPILGRGLAVGDLDGDGRPDVVVNALDAPAAILRNVSEGGRFLELDVVDRSGRPAVGARVRVTAGGRSQVAMVVAGGSYLSASASPFILRPRFGVGRASDRGRPGRGANASSGRSRLRSTHTHSAHQTRDRPRQAVTSCVIMCATCPGRRYIMSQHGGPDQHTLQCMEIWGGIEPVERTVSTPGLDLWVFSQPFGGDEQGGDVYYVTLCGGGLITRIVVADVSGHGASVAEFSLSLRSLLRKNINQKSQKRLVERLNRQFADMAEMRRFATALVITYLASTDRLSVCNAGHPRPLFYPGDRWRVVVTVAKG